MVVGMQHQQQQPHASPATVLEDATTPCAGSPQPISVSSAVVVSSSSDGSINDDTVRVKCSSSKISPCKEACLKSVVHSATQSKSRVKLRDVNPHLVCVLCHGYFVDATSIAECLHSFCRSCIILYLGTKNYCPICEVSINNSKPHLSLKPDKTLQDIVYKLVPGLFHAEMERRNQFYQDHPNRDLHLHPEFRGITVDRLVYSPSDIICFYLEYFNHSDKIEDVEIINNQRVTAKPAPTSMKNINTNQCNGMRYYSCPAGFRVSVLKKLIKMKEAIDANYTLELYYRRECLPDEYTLMDIAYIYAWKRNSPMQFSYRILMEVSPKQLPNIIPSNFIVEKPSQLSPSTVQDKFVKNDSKGEYHFEQTEEQMSNIINSKVENDEVISVSADVSRDIKTDVSVSKDAKVNNQNSESNLSPKKITIRKLSDSHDNLSISNEQKIQSSLNTPVLTDNSKFKTVNNLTNGSATIPVISSPKSVTKTRSTNVILNKKIDKSKLRASVSKSDIGVKKKPITKPDICVKKKSITKSDICIKMKPITSYLSISSILNDIEKPDMKKSVPNRTNGSPSLHNKDCNNTLLKLPANPFPVSLSLSSESSSLIDTSIPTCKITKSVTDLKLSDTSSNKSSSLATANLSDTQLEALSSTSSNILPKNCALQYSANVNKTSISQVEPELSSVNTNFQSKSSSINLDLTDNSNSSQNINVAVSNISTLTTSVSSPTSLSSIIPVNHCESISTANSNSVDLSHSLTTYVTSNKQITTLVSSAVSPILLNKSTSSSSNINSVNSNYKIASSASSACVIPGNKSTLSPNVSAASVLSTTPNKTVCVPNFNTNTISQVNYVQSPTSIKSSLVVKNLPVSSTQCQSMLATVVNSDASSGTVSAFDLPLKISSSITTSLPSTIDSKLSVSPVTILQNKTIEKKSLQEKTDNSNITLRSKFLNSSSQSITCTPQVSISEANSNEISVKSLPKSSAMIPESKSVMQICTASGKSISALKNTLVTVSSCNEPKVSTLSIPSSLPPLITLINSTSTNSLSYTSAVKKGTDSSLTSSPQYILSTTKIPASLEISLTQSSSSIKDAKSSSSSAYNLQKMVHQNLLNGSTFVKLDDRSHESSVETKEDTLLFKSKNSLQKDKILQNGELSVSSSDIGMPTKKIFSPNILPEVSITLNPHPENNKRISPETMYDVSCFKPAAVPSKKDLSTNTVPPLTPITSPLRKNIINSPIKNLNKKISNSFRPIRSRNLELAQNETVLNKINVSNLKRNSEQPIMDTNAKRLRLENGISQTQIHRTESNSFQSSLFDKSSLINSKSLSGVKKKIVSGRHTEIPKLIDIKAAPYTKLMAQNAKSRLNYLNKLNSNLYVKTTMSSNKTDGDNALDLSSPSNKSPASEKSMDKLPSPDKQKLIISVPPHMIPVTMAGKYESKLAPSSVSKSTIGKLERKLSSNFKTEMAKVSPTKRKCDNGLQQPESSIASKSLRQSSPVVMPDTGNVVKTSTPPVLSNNIKKCSPSMYTKSPISSINALRYPIPLDIFTNNNAPINYICQQQLEWKRMLNLQEDWIMNAMRCGVLSPHSFLHSTALSKPPTSQESTFDLKK